MSLVSLSSQHATGSYSNHTFPTNNTKWSYSRPIYPHNSYAHQFMSTHMYTICLNFNLCNSRCPNPLTRIGLWIFKYCYAQWRIKDFCSSVAKVLSGTGGSGVGAREAIIFWVILSFIQIIAL